MKEINLLIGGEAGQGLVTLGQLLSKALVRAGYEVLVTQSYHSRIRGGHNTFSIRIDTQKPLSPKNQIDILVAFDSETVELHKKTLAPDAILVADISITSGNGAGSPGIPFKELAVPRYHNVVALGILGTWLGLESELLLEVISDLIGGKHPEISEKNSQALQNGYKWGVINKIAADKLPPPLTSKPRLLLNGNEAIALGALSAGLKFCSFYPMTPATSIVLNIIAHADAMGCVVEQAEDEIAAINMAIGASFVGAPSMTATSGGGFALMTEGVSLAGMTETPIVIVVAQRPGPATGLPTRTEQGDLEFVLHAGHGEFPRIIFAPGSVESCYHLTRKALMMAEQYQGPVFILTDQFLADSSRAVLPFDLSESEPVTAAAEAAKSDIPYRRYAITENGISPRLIPGKTASLVAADSDEHTEDGHITEDLTIRNRMVEKRLRKLNGIYGEVSAPKLTGADNPDVILISWGSSQGAVQEAVDILQKNSIAAASLHFEQIWPLVPEQFLDSLQSAVRVICVEGNATGQFARLIRRETGFTIKELVLRYDGLPFTADYITDKIKENNP